VAVNDGLPRQGGCEFEDGDAGIAALGNVSTRAQYSSSITVAFVLAALSAALLAAWLISTGQTSPSRLGYAHKLSLQAYFDDADVLAAAARSPADAAPPRKVLIETNPFNEGPRFNFEARIAERPRSCLQTPPSAGEAKHCKTQIPEIDLAPKVFWVSPKEYSSGREKLSDSREARIYMALSELFGTLSIESPYPHRTPAEFNFSISGYKLQDLQKIISAYPSNRSTIVDPAAFSGRESNPGPCGPTQLVDASTRQNLEASRVCILYSADLTNSHTLMLIELAKKIEQPAELDVDTCRTMLAENRMLFGFPTEFGACVGAVWGGLRAQQLSIHIFEFRQSIPRKLN
jgi:hypothetical protein